MQEVKVDEALRAWGGGLDCNTVWVDSQDVEDQWARAWKASGSGHGRPVGQGVEGQWIRAWKASGPGCFCGSRSKTVAKLEQCPS